VSRPEGTESVLSVMHRPPAQRNLPAEVVDLPEPASIGRARTERIGHESRHSEPSSYQTGARVTGGRLVPLHQPNDDVAIDDLAIDDLAIDDLAIDDAEIHDLEIDEPADDSEGVDREFSSAAAEPEAPRIDPRLVALAEMNAADPRHGSLRRTVIEAHLPLVHHLAQRFRGRGEPYDDLVQVGTIGLLHAVDRYDPGRGSFAAFAVPTIVGEIRRHFRDRGWALRIPRRVQDLGRRVSEARETLTHGLDRSPTVGELASYLQVDSDLVLEALETASAYITVPLPITADESDRMARAFEDSGLELVEQRETLRPLLAQLPLRQQRILEMRFFRGMSQSQIASEIGVSQMHVSRLLAKSLSALRSELTQEL
jgi:RNA polymerase sigma-B factor